MKLDQPGLAAIVTGGGSGLGLATATALVRANVRVAILDVNEQAGQAAAAASGAHFIRTDVTSDADIDAAFAEARSVNGQERILVNCAGTGDAIKTVSRDKATGAIKRYPMEKFRRVIDINLMGSFRCISAAAAGMLTLDPQEDGERGVIINTASVAATDGQMGQACYAASKAAIVGMTLPIARDLMGEGIRVNTILPGIFDTPLMQGSADNVKAALAASVPFPKRFGRPDEFAEAALFIICSGYLNGEHIRLDGAIRMPPR